MRVRWVYPERTTTLYIHGKNRPSQTNRNGRGIAVPAKLYTSLKAVMLLLRELILSSQKGITEHIKWNGPSFCYGGDDRITFNLHRKDHILVVFHCGAKAKGTETRGGDSAFSRQYRPAGMVIRSTGHKQVLQ